MFVEKDSLGGQFGLAPSGNAEGPRDFFHVILASLVELSAWVFISGFWVISFGRRVPLIPSGVPTFPRVIIILFRPSPIPVSVIPSSSICLGVIKL